MPVQENELENVRTSSRGRPLRPTNRTWWRSSTTTTPKFCQGTRPSRSLPTSLESVLPPCVSLEVQQRPSIQSPPTKPSPSSKINVSVIPPHEASPPQSSRHPTNTNVSAYHVANSPIVRSSAYFSPPLSPVPALVQDELDYVNSDTTSCRRGFHHTTSTLDVRSLSPLPMPQSQSQPSSLPTQYVTASSEGDVLCTFCNPTFKPSSSESRGKESHCHVCHYPIVSASDSVVSSTTFLLSHISFTPLPIFTSQDLNQPSSVDVLVPSLQCRQKRTSFIAHGHKSDATRTNKWIGQLQSVAALARPTKKRRLSGI